MNQSPYLLGRKCEGRAAIKDKSWFRLTELKDIARQIGISQSFTKDLMCQRIREHLQNNPVLTIELDKKYGIKTKTIPDKKEELYMTLETMMKEYNIPDMESLIDLSDQELEHLIDAINLHDGKENLRDMVIGKNKKQKIKILVEEMSAKLCRCIDKIDPKIELGGRIGICIGKIFHAKGISISRFKCLPTPMLFPKKGSTIVIRKYDSLNPKKK